MKNLFRILTINIILILTHQCVNAQSTWQWAKSFGDTASEEFGTRIATDVAGYVYVTGKYRDAPIIFGTTTLAPAPGDWKIFVTKLNPAGDVLWATSISEAEPNGIAVDGSGNVYVAGSFSSAVLNFGSTVLPNFYNSTHDIFVAKYDANGNLVWARSGGSSGKDYVQNMCADDAGHVYLTGNFDSATLVLGGDTLNNMGQHDIFVAKYDTDGHELWLKSAGGLNNESAYAIATTGSVLYITGGFETNSPAFGSTTLTCQGGIDVFLAAYDTTGNCLWAKKAGGTGYERAYGVASAGGYIYITGYFDLPATFGTTTLTPLGLIDVFVAKYDAAGNIQWARSAGGTDLDGSMGLSADAAGNVYVAGFYYSAAAEFDHITVYSSGISYTAFFAKYDAAGNVVSVKIPVSAVGNSEGTSICASPAGHVYVTGRFASTTTFGGTTLVSSNHGNVYVAKIDSPVGIEEYGSSETVDIFPNPFSLKATIQFKKPTTNATLVIYNAAGQIVNQTGNINGQSIVIERRGLAAGIYYCRVEEDGRVMQVAKIVLAD